MRCEGQQGEDAWRRLKFQKTDGSLTYINPWDSYCAEDLIKLNVRVERGRFYLF